jgi:hypothetical protein
MRFKKGAKNMRRVGTVTAAAGLIFLGVWSILTNIDKSIADQMFKWWPVIIIFIGIEILVFLKQSTAEKKPRLSGLFIAVIIVFLVLNATQHVHSKFETMFHQHTVAISGDHFNWLNSDYKKIHVAKTIPFSPKEIVISANNGVFNIKKSPDNTLKIDGDIYVDKSSTLSEWEINEATDGTSTKLDFNGPVIAGASVDIYVPDGTSLRFESGYLKFDSTSANLDRLTVDCNDGNLNLGNIKNIQVKMHEGKAAVHSNSDCIIMDINNGKLDIDGRINNLTVNMNDGKVDINNEAESYANIQMNHGIVNYDTQNKDANVTLSVADGIGILNGRKIDSGEISTTFGAGNSKINMKVGNGKLSFSNRE